MIAISEDTQKVIDFLQDYTKKNLRKPVDLATILEISALNSDHNFVINLVFIGKSLWNLNRAFTKSQGTDNQNLERELQKNFVEMQESLAKLIDEIEDEETKERFRSVYLQNTLGCFRNMIDLSYDLTKLKDLMSDMQKK
jgi:hypothetical protein